MFFFAVEDGPFTLRLEIGDGRRGDVLCDVVSVLFPEVKAQVDRITMRNCWKAVASCPMDKAQFELG